MSLLVDAAWVAERLGSGEVLLVDATLPPVGVMPKVDTRARYVEKHLPGAVFFDMEALSDPDTDLPHMLLPPERFGREMDALGVPSAGPEQGGKTLVVYEQVGVFSAPRAWWMLRVMGAADVRVLQGGLTAWEAAGLPVESEEVPAASARFDAVLDRDAVAGLAVLKAALERGEQVVDARSAARFAGTAPEPRAGLQSGHMPGALSVPYTELVADGRMKPAAEIASVFAEHGVDVERPVMTTCGSGVTAAVLALGLELCGAKQVRLYDGSWAEYASRPDAPIIKG
ncbi:3-mercaptopyruvate sulfurtransferase [Terriglobus sp.]|uniref:3-mercaptopyruvate sulfurtransferase n=1 Tax=Terriglobus sp. TaxID=1889013 RepID=UPI003B00BB06